MEKKRKKCILKLAANTGAWNSMTTANNEKCKYNLKKLAVESTMAKHQSQGVIMGKFFSHKVKGNKNCADPNKSLK